MQTTFVQSTVEFYQEKNNLDSDPEFSSGYGEFSTNILVEQQQQEKNLHEKTPAGSLRRKSLFRNFEEVEANTNEKTPNEKSFLSFRQKTLFSNPEEASPQNEQEIFNDQLNGPFRKKSIKIRVDLPSVGKFEESLARSGMLLQSPTLPVRNGAATPLNQKEFEEESNKFGGKSVEEDDIKSPGINNRKIAFEEDEKKKRGTSQIAFEEEDRKKRGTTQFVKPYVATFDNQEFFMYDFEEAANFKHYFKNNNKEQVIMKYAHLKKSTRRKNNKVKTIKSKNYQEFT